MAMGMQSNQKIIKTNWDHNGIKMINKIKKKKKKKRKKKK